MERTRSSRRWPVIGLVLVGVMLGGLFLKPAVAHVASWAHNWTVHIKPRVQAFGDGRWVRKAAVQTGYFSCAGTAWESAFGGTTYDTSGSEKFRTGGDTGLFRCSVNLPNGASVTAARFSVEDTDPTDVTCELWRTNMVTGIGTETLMADASSSGTPGSVQISDTTVESPLIDNAKFAYFAQCLVSGTTSAAGVYGANIQYKVTGLKGAAAAPVRSGVSGSSTG